MALYPRTVRDSSRYAYQLNRQDVVCPLSKWGIDAHKRWSNLPHRYSVCKHKHDSQLQYWTMVRDLTTQKTIGIVYCRLIKQDWMKKKRFFPSSLPWEMTDFCQTQFGWKREYVLIGASFVWWLSFILRQNAKVDTSRGELVLEQKKKKKENNFQWKSVLMNILQPSLMQSTLW